jgi:hypothetical protein
LKGYKWPFSDRQPADKALWPHIGLRRRQRHRSVRAGSPFGHRQVWRARVRESPEKKTPQCRRSPNLEKPRVDPEAGKAVPSSGQFGTGCLILVRRPNRTRSPQDRALPMICYGNTDKESTSPSEFLPSCEDCSTEHSHQVERNFVRDGLWFEGHSQRVCSWVGAPVRLRPRGRPKQVRNRSDEPCEQLSLKRE